MSCSHSVCYSANVKTTVAAMRPKLDATTESGVWCLYCYHCVRVWTERPSFNDVWSPARSLRAFQKAAAGPLSGSPSAQLNGGSEHVQGLEDLAIVHTGIKHRG